MGTIDEKMVHNLISWKLQQNYGNVIRKKLVASISSIIGRIKNRTIEINWWYRGLKNRKIGVIIIGWKTWRTKKRNIHKMRIHN